MTDGNINRSTHDVFQAGIRDYSVCDTRIFPINIIAVKKKKTVCRCRCVSVNIHTPPIHLTATKSTKSPSCITRHDE